MATLAGFSSFGERLIFGSDVGVVGGCDECRHVEGLAQDGAATANITLAAMLSAVMGLRCKACATGDLPVVELPKLEHFDQHGGGGQRADAGDRNKDLEAGNK